MTHVAAAIVLVLALALPSTAAGQQPITPLAAQFRLTTTGTDGDPAYRAQGAVAAYDPSRDRYLLVYDAADPVDRSIYTRLLGPDGLPLGPPALIGVATSSSVTDLDEAPNADVAYNAVSDRYLIVYSGPPNPGDGNQVYAVALMPDGATVAAGPEAVSQTVTAGRDALQPTVIERPGSQDVLVAWQSDGGYAGQASSAWEIFAARVDTATATPEAQQRVTTSADGDDARSVRGVFVPSDAGNRYLLVFEGSVQGNSDVHGIRVGPGGAPVASSVNVSKGSSSTLADDFLPDVVLDAGTGQLLIVFMREVSEVNGLGDSEIHAMRTDAFFDQALAPTPVSSVGPLGNTSFNAELPRIAYHPLLDRYLVTWRADGAAAGTVENEYEMFGQVITRDGVQVGDDARISTLGADGQAQADAVAAQSSLFLAGPPHALVASATRKEWLVAYPGDGEGGLADDEFEIFGRVFGENPDGDGDGASVPSDCDDGNAAVHPGAAEVFDNGIDENCDGADAADPDRDHDGVSRFANPPDCNDGNPFIHPGATDIAGNGVDEDCSGADTPLPPVLTTATVFLVWAYSGRTTRVTSLLVRKAKAGMQVDVLCRGGGCPDAFTRRTYRFTIRSTGGNAERPRVRCTGRACPSRAALRRLAGRVTIKGRQVQLRGLLKGARLRPRSTLEVRVLEPTRVGIARRYTFRPRKAPRTRGRCLTPGSTTTVACPG